MNAASGLSEEALASAAKKLRRLRLTNSYAIMDEADSAETVKSVLKRGLGGLYGDDVVEYILAFGIKYYLEAVKAPAAIEVQHSRSWVCRCGLTSASPKCPHCGEPKPKEAAR